MTLAIKHRTRLANGIPPHARGLRPCGIPRARGFTLIEMMVVLLIISVLVLIGVGIAKYAYDRSAREQTKAILTQLSVAVDKYYEITGSYPADSPDGKGIFTTLTDTTAAGGRITAEIQPVLNKLPQNAVGSTTFVDAYGQAITYSATGGIGGKPVLISPGPKGADPIRSDQ